MPWVGLSLGLEEASLTSITSVPRELGGGAHRRSVVGRHHSAVRCRLLRRDDPRPQQIPTIYGTCVSTANLTEQNQKKSFYLPEIKIERPIGPNTKARKPRCIHRSAEHDVTLPGIVLANLVGTYPYTQCS